MSWSQILSSPAWFVWILLLGCQITPFHVEVLSWNILSKQFHQHFGFLDVGNSLLAEKALTLAWPFHFWLLLSSQVSSNPKLSKSAMILSDITIYCKIWYRLFSVHSSMSRFLQWRSKPGGNEHLVSMDAGKTTSRACIAARLRMVCQICGLGVLSHSSDRWCKLGSNQQNSSPVRPGRGSPPSRSFPRFLPLRGSCSSPDRGSKDRRTAATFTVRLH